tara:strand:+ start:86 stop:508 length:423 start_codon:yes stop_codon:yes gene_type:complete
LIITIKKKKIIYNMALDQFSERIKNLNKKKTNVKNENDKKIKMTLKEKVIDSIKTIYDPEIPVNIYALGLIYDIIIENNNVKVKMTLTTPNCPVAESLPKEVKDIILEIKEVNNVDLDLVWEPPWDKSMMSEAAKLELNL